MTGRPRAASAWGRRAIRRRRWAPHRGPAGSGHGVGGEAALLRRTRLRLIAWSAGSTLLVLVVLGVAIYVATATSLSAAATAQLRDRMQEMAVAAGRGPLVQSLSVRGGGSPNVAVGVTSDPGQPGVLLGGSASGTIAFVVNAPLGATGGTVTGGGALFPAQAAEPLPASIAGAGGPAAVGPMTGVAFVPDAALIDAAVAEGSVVRETSIGTIPARVVAAASTAGGNRLVTVVIGDRRAELETLRTLLAVLLGGGLLVLVASVALGYVYAGRALVPIRESLRRQREFAADASHELRTPLAINRAALAELRRGRDDPATVDRALDDLDAGATRVEALVDDLLLLARTDAGAVELALADTDLALAAAEASESLEPVAAARGIRIVLDLEPAPLRGDEARLRQLARILVDNAIRHAPAGGRVTVAVRPGATLVVEDDGPGIDPAHLEVVFERFWRAPGAPAGGTGLGLAIARWIAERHGGSIHADGRADGPGARFVVRLPAS